MKNPLIALSLAAGALAAPVWADAGEGALSAPPQNIVQLSASGQVDVRQDLLTISLGTTREGAEAAAVQTQLKQALDAALAEARRVAQPGQLEVHTGPFSLSPRYGRDGKVNGWHGSAALVLEGRDFARISALAGRIQTLSISGVSFGLSREERARAESEAQAAAIDRFKGKAESIARGFGFSGYTLREVAVNANDPGPSPRPRYMALEKAAALADAPVPVEAGQSTVTVTVSGAVQMK